jgi:lysophospholipid acyltransferase (LPLAT)-like uncharacterized protein
VAGNVSGVNRGNSKEITSRFPSCHPTSLLHRTELPLRYHVTDFFAHLRSVERQSHVLLGATAGFAENPRVSESSSPSLVHGISGWRSFLLWPLGLLMRLWGMTLRFETSPEDLERYRTRDQPVAIVLWHNRLFLSAEIVRRFRKGRPAYALVSASRDGAWLSAFFSIVGMRTVRGSSSRLGREAATALVEVLRKGDDIGITPDGPRGPCYDLKPGALIVARRTKAPLILVGAKFRSAWRMKSWDRFYLPKPFSRVQMRCIVVPPEALTDRDAAAERVRELLLGINPD